MPNSLYVFLLAIFWKMVTVCKYTKKIKSGREESRKVESQRTSVTVPTAVWIRSGVMSEV